MTTVLPAPRNTVVFLQSHAFSDTTFAAVLMNGPIANGGWLFADDKWCLETILNRKFPVLPHAAGGMIRVPLEGHSHIEIVRIR